ncbi:MAG: glycosyltransferase family 4 protein, partial [Candidatus Omnitrophica bacterium]|nr:glycosyltransferase family 4 protein [Candidatus Omnitrophota bacterium]
IEDNISWLKKFFYKAGNAAVKKWFQKTVVVSEGLKKEITEHHFRAPETVEVIHLGVQIPQEFKKAEYPFEGLRTGRPLIGTISRFSREKGLERFLLAIPAVLRQIPQSTFILIGKGDEESNLTALAKKLGIEEKLAIQTIKDWSDELVYGNLEKIDIFVMPSLREGCPTSLLQALAFARPVIASDIEGVRDIIEDGKNGILADTADTSAFADKIVLLSKDRERALCLGNRGRDKVNADFTIDSEMAKIRK